MVLVVVWMDIVSVVLSMVPVVDPEASADCVPSPGSRASRYPMKNPPTMPTSKAVGMRPQSQPRPDAVPPDVPLLGEDVGFAPAATGAPQSEQKRASGPT